MSLLAREGSMTMCWISQESLHTQLLYVDLLVCHVAYYGT